jgi:hypothetical protein
MIIIDDSATKNYGKKISDRWESNIQTVDLDYSIVLGVYALFGSQDKSKSQNNRMLKHCYSGFRN